MSILVIAEHDHISIKTATLNAVTAASRIGGEIHLLVAGKDCTSVADEAVKISGVAKVLLADAPQYADQLPENLAALVVAKAAPNALRSSRSGCLSSSPRIKGIRLPARAPMW